MRPCLKAFGVPQGYSGETTVPATVDPHLEYRYSIPPTHVPVPVPHVPVHTVACAGCDAAIDTPMGPFHETNKHRTPQSLSTNTDTGGGGLTRGSPAGRNAALTYRFRFVAGSNAGREHDSLLLHLGIDESSTFLLEIVTKPRSTHLCTPCRCKLCMPVPARGAECTNLIEHAC